MFTATPPREQEDTQATSFALPTLSYRRRPWVCDQRRAGRQGGRSLTSWPSRSNRRWEPTSVLLTTRSPRCMTSHGSSRAPTFARCRFPSRLYRLRSRPTQRHHQQVTRNSRCSCRWQAPSPSRHPAGSLVSCTHCDVIVFTSLSTVVVRSARHSSWMSRASRASCRPRDIDLDPRAAAASMGLDPQPVADAANARASRFPCG